MYTRFFSSWQGQWKWSPRYPKIISTFHFSSTMDFLCQRFQLHLALRFWSRRWSTRWRCAFVRHEWFCTRALAWNHEPYTKDECVKQILFWLMGWQQYPSFSDGTWKPDLEDPMIPFDLEESSKRMYLHLRRKENRWKKLYSGPLGCMKAVPPWVNSMQMWGWRPP